MQSDFSGNSGLTQLYLNVCRLPPTPHAPWAAGTAPLACVPICPWIFAPPSTMESPECSLEVAEFESLILYKDRWLHLKFLASISLSLGSSSKSPNICREICCPPPALTRAEEVCCSRQLLASSWPFSNTAFKHNEAGTTESSSQKALLPFLSSNRDLLPLIHIQGWFHSVSGIEKSPADSKISQTWSHSGRGTFAPSQGLRRLQVWLVLTPTLREFSPNWFIWASSVTRKVGQQPEPQSKAWCAHLLMKS